MSEFFEIIAKIPDLEHRIVSANFYPKNGRALAFFVRPKTLFSQLFICVWSVLSILTYRRLVGTLYKLLFQRSV